MRGQILIGVIAGLASVLLFGSLITGSPLAFLTFYLAALPLFIAGFGWSWPVAGIGAVVGASVLALVGGALSGVIYVLATAAPAVWLSQLAMSRRLPEAGGEASTPGTWYPAGMLVVWAALIGGALVLASTVALGFTYESYHGTLRQFAARMLESFQARGGAALPLGTKLDEVADGIARLAPVATACAWMATTLLNMYLSGLIIKASGRLHRPWPALADIAFPPVLAWAMLAALALSFLPGMVGLIAGVFAATFTIAYGVLGLAIMHAVTAGASMRPLILGGVYLATLFMGCPIIVLAALGLGEPLFKLRARAGARRPPSPPPPGNT